MKKGLLVQIILIITIVCSYFLVDFNKIYNSFKPKTTFAKQENCDLHKTPCSVTMKNGETFTLEVFPKNIPLMEALTFKVTSSNKDIEYIDLRLYSINMFMGDFNLRLNKIKDGIYQIKSLLPTCPVGNAIWNADIEVGSIGAKFIFETE